MSVLIDRSTKLLVQGITGRDGSFHARQMMDYGTRVVGGVVPGKGGQKFESEVPIFDTVAEAMEATEADASVIYVPPVFAADAIYEAADAGVGLIVAITEGIPVLDMTRAMPFVDDQGKESLNFQITVTIAAIVAAVLIVLLVGFLLLPIVGLIALVFTIIAGIKANEGVAYRYPFALRLIK